MAKKWTYLSYGWTLNIFVIFLENGHMYHMALTLDIFILWLENGGYGQENIPQKQVIKYAISRTYELRIQ